MFGRKKSEGANTLMKKRAVYTCVDSNQQRMVQDHDGASTAVGCKSRSLVPKPFRGLVSRLANKAKTIGYQHKIVQRVQLALRRRKDSFDDRDEPPPYFDSHSTTPVLRDALRTHHDRQHVESYYDVSSSTIDAQTIYSDDTMSETSTFSLGIPDRDLPPGLRVTNPSPLDDQSTTFTLDLPDQDLPPGLRVTNFSAADEQARVDEHFLEFDSGLYCDSMPEEDDIGNERSSTFTLGVPDHELPPGLRVMNFSLADRLALVDGGFHGPAGGPRCGSRTYNEDEEIPRGRSDSAFSRKEEKVKEEKVWWRM